MFLILPEHLAISDLPQHTESQKWLNWKLNKKDRWDSGKPRCQQILFCDIQIKVVISRRQIYVYGMSLRFWVVADVYGIIPYTTATTQNLSDIDFDLSRSLKVKSNGVIRLTIYSFLLVCNNNVGPM